MLVLAWSIAAHADAAPCMGLQVTDTQPAADAIDVPIDVRPRLQLYGDCGGSPDWTFEVRAPGEGGAIYASLDATLDLNALPVVIEVVPDADLPAETDLLLVATPTADPYGAGYTREFAFRTGTGVVAGVTGAPSVQVNDAWWRKSDNYLGVNGEITPAADPDALSVLRVTGPGSEFTVFAEFPTTWVSFDAPADEAPEEACITVVQIDGNGVESAPVEACSPVTVDDSGGCNGSSTAEPVQALLGLAGLGLLLRRRR